MSHDQRYKNLLLDYPRESLEFFAVPEAQRLEGARILPVRQEQLQERFGERFRELDTPLLVEWPDGEREALVFLVEEETEPGRFSIPRLIHYCVDIADLLQTHRVVPVVIFLRPGNPPTGLVLSGDQGPYLWFRYLAMHLSRTPAEAHLDSGNIVARINLPTMNHPPERKVEVYAAAVTGLLELDQDPERHRKYLDFIDAYSDLAPQERRQAQQVILETLNRDGEAPRMGGITQLWREEGIELGIQQGIQQGVGRGRQEGEVKLLRRLLSHRFGALPAWVEERLSQAPEAELETWGDRLLDATTLEQVFERH
jgi:hypothetical protein